MADETGWRFLDDAPIPTDRYARVRSPLKYCVLEIVDRRAGVTYLELADELDMPTEYAADRLIKYRRAGLLVSETNAGDSGRRSTFQLSDRGRKRLIYFKNF